MGVLATMFVVAAGALNAVQSGSNATLARSLGRPWLVGVLVSLVTAAALVAGMLVTGARMPEPGKLATVPWWAWTGGLCGAAYVVSTLFFAEGMGAGLFTGLTITAGIVASIVVDRSPPPRGDWPPASKGPLRRSPWPPERSLSGNPA